MNNGNVTVMITNTVDEALKLWVPHGYTTFFMVFNEGMMVMRSTDLRGFPSQPRFFELTEKFQYGQPQQIQQPAVNQQSPTIDSSQFATKAEFDELKALIIQSMNNPQPVQTNSQPQQRNDKRKGGNNS